jgi:hypothetical protein
VAHSWKWQRRAKTTLNAWFFSLYELTKITESLTAEDPVSCQRKQSDSESGQPLPTVWSLKFVDAKKRNNVVGGKIKGGLPVLVLDLLVACCAGKWDVFIHAGSMNIKFQDLRTVTALVRCRPLNFHCSFVHLLVVVRHDYVTWDKLSIYFTLHLN